MLLHLLWASWAGVAVVAGDAVRARAQRVAAMAGRARVLEETREEEARRRVAEERPRLARELHDVVAHSLASISVQAGMGAHIIDRRSRSGTEVLGLLRVADDDAQTVVMVAGGGPLRRRGRARRRGGRPGGVVAPRPRSWTAWCW